MFIQIIQGKCTRQDELKALGERWVKEIASKADGWLGGTYGFTDDDMFVGVIRFESREKAMAHSSSPEQTRWWQEMEPLFDGPVEFHDCDTVMLMMEGGRDDAGFVQVIRGKVDDPARLQADMDEMSSMLHEIRPDIIGATLAIEPDGTFTETVAFTSEEAAREGESKEMPLNEKVRHAMQEWESLTHDLTYMDLHHPWFTSKATATT
ncbi:MAG TPA: hypothetical protein VLA97_13470 [Nocardioidaceae bacterium]|nr:hypothetical protein [Nocardioidaceae bacterium]